MKIRPEYDVTPENSGAPAIATGVERPEYEGSPEHPELAAPYHDDPTVETGPNPPLDGWRAEPTPPDPDDDVIRGLEVPRQGWFRGDEFD